MCISCLNAGLLTLTAMIMYAIAIVHWFRDDRPMGAVLLIVAIYLTRRAVVWYQSVWSGVWPSVDNPEIVLLNVVMMFGAALYAGTAALWRCKDG